jgi:tRNA pseudouridine(55) synthase
MSAYLGFDPDRQVLEIGNTYSRPHLRGTGFNLRVKDMMLRRAFDCGSPPGRVPRRQPQRAQFGLRWPRSARSRGVLRADRITWTGHVRDHRAFLDTGGGVAIHGWLIIDKPVGPGSTQVVSAVKRALRDGGYPKLKVGHGGTLGSAGERVLPVALVKRPSFAGGCWMRTRFTSSRVRFGAETSTLDAEGEVVATSDVRPTLDEVEAVLPSFTGAIEQVPPVYSALKVDGRRAYDLARAGEQVEMKSRRVTIHALSIRHSRESGRSRFSFDAAVEEQRDSRFRGNDRVTLIARVSKGTYIRSLARDIAHALGTVGTSRC